MWVFIRSASLCNNYGMKYLRWIEVERGRGGCGEHSLVLQCIFGGKNDNNSKNVLMRQTQRASVVWFPSTKKKKNRWGYEFDELVSHGLL